MRTPEPIAKLFSFLLAILMIAFLAPAQLQAGDFSSDPKTFGEQLTAFMTKSTREDVKITVETFVASIESGTIGSQIEEIIATCNNMQDLRMRATPHFKAYLDAINALVESGDYEKTFPAWHAIMKDVVAKTTRGNLRRFSSFAEFSDVFFTDRSLYRTSGKAWQLGEGSYEFQYENDTPRIQIMSTNLIAATKKDTVTIYNTGGIFNAFTNVWDGVNGKATWERVGLSSAEVYAELGEYQVNVESSEYEAYDVMFFHTKYFARPVKGDFKDQLSATKVSGDYIFPQFVSHDLNIQLTDISDNIKYLGGFGMEGAKIVGVGTADNKARMDFFAEDGKLALRAFSTRFGVKEGKEINSKNTQASFYFAQDSIYHPNLSLKYKIPERELRLVRENKASSQIAYMSSFHALEANVDVIRWQTSQPVVDFEMASEIKDQRVVFESFNLYDEQRLNRYSSVTDVDPVRACYELASGGDYRIHIDDFAKYLDGRYTKESILSSVFDMVEDGFIFYDTESDIITIRPKAENYLLSKKGEIDYDRIMLISETDQQNAQLDLETRDLLVTGVESVTLSDSQNVVLHPKSGYIKVNQNRDMEMNGTIVAGSVDFTGSEFGFQYDDFIIDMDTVRSMLIYLYDETGQRETVGDYLAPIKTTIQDVSGTLFIDRKDNKSGRESLPSYPKFESDGNSFLYYNKKKLFNGAYKKDSFYFKLNPFKFEDIDEIQPEQLQFDGTMVTAGIFPDFEQTTELQEDFSLGFSRDTDASGFSTYGKGRYYGSINMSDKGLRGAGKLEYLASTSWAEDFIFMPDSMLTKADSFYIARSTVKGIEFPNAHNGDVKMKWLPKRDSLIVDMGKRPFMMFEDKLTMKGKLIMRDTGLAGMGTMSWDEASVRSNVFEYSSGAFGADSADVVIKNKEVAKVAFNSYNVNAKVDVDNRLGEFKANGENIPIVLPYNQYKTTASEFYWIMDEKLINIRMPEDTRQAYFESTHKDQDGLKFQASGGVVNLADNSIKVDGIPFINVADAKIRPQNTQVIVRPEAKIDRLEDALLVCDTLNEYHKITNASIKIKGKNQLEGSGDYKYKAKGMKKQKIFFEEIVTKNTKDDKDEFAEELEDIGEATEDTETTADEALEELAETATKGKKGKGKKGAETEADPEETSAEESAEDTTEESTPPEDAVKVVEDSKKKKKAKKAKDDKGGWYTFASTSIPSDKPFKLSNNIEYKGDAILDSRKQFLIFDGYAKINLENEFLQPVWFAFKDEINPNNIQIDVTAPIGERKDTLLFGILNDLQELRPYPAFLSKKRSPIDEFIFRASGELDFNDETSTYRIGDKDRINGKTLRGNVLTLEDANGIVKADGKYNFGDDMGEVRLDVAGHMDYSMAGDSTNMSDIVVGLDFMIDEKLIDQIAQAFRYYNADSEEIDYTKGFTQAGAQLVAEKEVGKFVSTINQYAYLPEKMKGLDHTLIFTDLEMVYDDNLLSYRSRGDFGLAFAGDRYVNRMIKGHIEFIPRKTGDSFSIYLETDKDELDGKKWFFMTYKKGMLEIISSDMGFNDMITSIKDKKRVIEDKKRGIIYQYRLCPIMKKKRFIMDMTGEADVEEYVPPTPVESETEGEGEELEGQPIDDGGVPIPEEEGTPDEEEAPAPVEEAPVYEPDPDNVPDAVKQFEEQQNKKGKGKKKKDKGKKGGNTGFDIFDDE